MATRWGGAGSVSALVFSRVDRARGESTSQACRHVPLARQTLTVQFSRLEVEEQQRRTRLDRCDLLHLIRWQPEETALEALRSRRTASHKQETALAAATATAAAAAAAAA
eukprot:SAG11_NODE_2303_length_3547_cov_7.916473_4_plen_109_part_01